MTHIDMSQSAKSYFHERRYDPFPIQDRTHPGYSNRSEKKNKYCEVCPNNYTVYQRSVFSLRYMDSEICTYLWS